MVTKPGHAKIVPIRKSDVDIPCHIVELGTEDEGHPYLLTRSILQISGR